jgi:hypothetical protein
VVNCVLCQQPIETQDESSLSALVEGERYPVCDDECRRLVEENPVEALGPLVTLRYRKPCQRCAKKVDLWRLAAAQRPLRLRVEEAPGLSECPQLLIGGEPDRFMGEVEDVSELLGLLYTSYPGFVGCC